MPPLVSEDYLEARKNQIIEAALGCFAQKGFHKTTMKDICAASKLSAGAVYNYFAGKEEIVEAIAVMSIERNLLMISDAAEQDGDDRLGHLLGKFFAMLEKMGQEPEVRKYLSIDFEMWSEASRNERVGATARRSQETTLSLVSGLIESEQRRGHVNGRLDPKAIARTLLSLLQGLQVQYVIDPSMDVGAYADVCKALIHSEFADAAGSNESGR